jgi:copper transport protein
VRLRLQGLAVLAALLALQPAVSAHAFLVSSDPAAGAVLIQAPAQVTLRFTQAPDAPLSTFVAYDDRRDQVSGRPEVSGRVVTLPLHPLGPGTYTLRWSVVSAEDGHATQGSFVFTVWRGGPLPAGVGAASASGGGLQGGALGSAARFAALLAAFAVAGAAFLAAALGWFPPGGAWAGVAFVACEIFAFLVQGAAATGVEPGRFLTGGFALPALSAPFGRLALLALLGGVSASVGLAARRRWFAVAGALVMVAGFALASHAASSVEPVLGAAVDGVHLASAAAWGGGLGWLLAVRRGRGLLPRFARWALPLMIATVAAGLGDALFTVHAPAALLQTFYGKVLDLKVLLLLAVLVAAAFSRRQVRRGRPERAVRPAAAEGILAVGILGAVAVLIGAPPATLAPPGRAAYFQEQRHVGALTVRLTVSPLIAGDNAVQVHLAAAGGSPPVSVTVQNLDMAMGTVTVPLAPRGGGDYATTTGALSMAGTWRLTVEAGGARVPFTVTVAPPGGGGVCDAGFDPGLHAAVSDLHDTVRAIAPDPSDPAVVLVAGDHGAHVSRDGGRTWTTALAGQPLVAAAVASEGSRWYAASAEGLWSSRDGGRSWTELPAPGPRLAALLPSPWQPDGLFVAAGDGLHHSADPGRQAWSTLAADPDVDTIASLAAVGGNLYAGSLQGILVSSDGGRTWHLAAPQARLALGFAADPAHPDTVWAAAMAQGLWVSRDRGRTWQESDQGVTNLGMMGIAAWGAGGRLLAGTMGGGLTASTDYGASWQTAGCPAAVIMTVAAGPGPTIWVGDREGVIRLAP